MVYYARIGGGSSSQVYEFGGAPRRKEKELRTFA